MLVRFFKGTGPGVIFVTSLTLVAVWLSPFLKMRGHFSLYFDLNPMPLYGIVSSLTGTNPLPGLLLSVFMTALMAVLIVNLNNSLFFINRRTFLPALIYILFSGLFPEYQVMNPSIFSAMFLMLAISRIMASYRVQGISYSFFDAGLLIGTGSLFYAGIIWFGVLIIIGIALLRMGNIKEVLIAAIGLLTPYVLLFGIYYVLGRNIDDLLSVIRYNMFEKESGYAFSRLIMVALAVIGFISVISLSNLIMEMNKKKIQSRKTFSLLIWMLIISLATYFSFSSVSVEMVWVTAVPLSYFIAHYLLFSKSRIIPELILSLMFLLIILIQVVNYR